MTGDEDAREDVDDAPLGRVHTHEPGDCSVWSWCTSEQWEPREDDPTRRVLVHARHTGLVGVGDVEVIVWVRAEDRQHPEVVLSMSEQRDVSIPAREWNGSVEVGVAMGAATTAEVVTALAEAVEIMATQTIAIGTLKAVRAAAGTSRCSR